MDLGILHFRWGKCVFILLALTALFSAPSTAQAPKNSLHDPRRKAPVGFSQELDYSPETILTAIKNAASAGVIYGSRIYRKDKDIEMAGAEPATTSSVFTDSPTSGQVFYKVRKDAVAPEHFPASTGRGTVTVRYIVQPLDSQRTKLRIDAVYFEESLRARYFSDGSVEEAEYDQIQNQLNSFTAPAAAGTPPTQPAAPTQDAVDLQNALVRQQTLLADAEAAKQKLEEQLKQLQFNTQGRVKSMAIPLKAYPYNSSSTILTLGKEEVVTVLKTSRYWYKVRTAKGEEGWIYYIFLESL